jgi:long-chain fatty acid transport protein
MLTRQFARNACDKIRAVFLPQIEVLRRFILRVSRLLIPLATLMIAGAAFGSGFALFEAGAKAVAMGGAFAAPATIPSAIFYNVAGIAQQQHRSPFRRDGHQFSTNTGDPTSVHGRARGNKYARNTLSFRAIRDPPVGNNMTFGVGVFSPFGLRTNWESWSRVAVVGREHQDRFGQPAFAWQTSDGRLAMGGAEYRRAKVILPASAHQSLHGRSRTSRIRTSPATGMSLRGWNPA